MRTFVRIMSWSVGSLVLVGLVALLSTAGCGSGGNSWQWYGSPYVVGANSNNGPSNTGQSTGTTGNQSDRTAKDPCTLAQSKKFVTISMRNITPDYIHYFFLAIAFVAPDPGETTPTIPALDDTAFPNGGVCKKDVTLYTQFGYTEVVAGQSVPVGDYCVHGPALYYLHRNGQFRRSIGSGANSLGSAIAPAQGTSATYDAFFTSLGAQVPVPDLILFHNPGTGEGASLKISRRSDAPCGGSGLSLSAAPVCLRDAFYYVDEDGLMAGSTRLGSGSGRRVPDEIQGTGCSCVLAGAYQALAPPGMNARGAFCNEFMRGGRIEYVFLRDDENPPFPQLVWKVTDSGGDVAHAFDARAGLP